MSEPNPSPMKGRKRQAPEGRTTLSAQLRDMIRNRGESAYAVAQQAGVDHRVVGRFLDGKTITLATADRLGAALNLRIGEGFASPVKARTKTRRKGA
jgi:hypothetical protein